MRKSKVAEWILALTTTPEHAASIVGDLTEQIGVHGTLWFWASLLRTTTALGWCTFAQAPGHVIWLAFYGTVIQCLYMLVATVPLGNAAALLAIGATELGMSQQRIFAAEIYVVVVATVLSFAMTSILYGKWLARKAPQRELAVYVVFWFLFVAPWAAILPSTSLVGVGPTVLVIALASIIGTIFTFVGVERERKQNAAA